MRGRGHGSPPSLDATARSEAAAQGLVWADPLAPVPRVTPGDSYLPTYRRILDVVSSVSGGEISADATSRIDTILAAQRRAWVTFQFDRLRQFGYGFAMF